MQKPLFIVFATTIFVISFFLIKPDLSSIIYSPNSIGDNGNIPAIGNDDIVPITPGTEPLIGGSGIININEVLTVNQINSSKDSYAGQRVRVKGKVNFTKDHSLRPCEPEEGSNCNLIIGGNMYLIDIDQPIGENGTLLVYKNGKQILCEEPFIGKENFECVEFEQDQIVILEGIFVKDRIPAMSVGTSGGEPAQVLKWTDFYYLNIQ